ncbi:hypothetical protein N657DRAFT_690371 [Parathielavia appendiculata]|uniref:Uncharacterized protein n=1 Tax=Parathielavia appendiculata TaxID=2587402 RepID=A0AAN6TZM9_9PEZI|nr:hypothetical protein N657DRAFT_690371 [Parathielavia appendiculata]
MEASPAKRRALGALDPNACSPKVRSGAKVLSAQLSPVKIKTAGPRHMDTMVSASSPSSSPQKATDSRKRRSPTPASRDNVSRATRHEALSSEPVPKRPCLDHNTREDLRPRREESPPSSTSTARTTAFTTTRRRSVSPDSPSVFDTSAVDTSQATILTEPDTSAPALTVPPPAAAPVPRSNSRLTREQTREKAEILRLRLGLASYKVRTGQTDVPLDRLEARHLAAPSRGPGLSRARSFSDDQGQSRHRLQDAYHGPTSVSASFPPPGASSTSTSSSSATAVAVAGRRRPLPDAPVRRGSNGSVDGNERERERERELGPAARALEKVLEQARLEREQERRERHQHYQHHHQQHQRRQSELMNRRYEDAPRYSGAGGIPPRPRTATEVGELYRRVGGSSRVDDERMEEEDLEGRGGAASGLLSLARS